MVGPGSWPARSGRCNGTLHVLYLLENEPLEATVDLPPAGWVCLATLLDGASRPRAEALLARAQALDVWGETPAARDFWVAPEGAGLFLMAPDRLKPVGGPTE